MAVETIAAGHDAARGYVDAWGSGRQEMRLSSWVIRTHTLHALRMRLLTDTSTSVAVERATALLHTPVELHSRSSSPQKRPCIQRPEIPVIISVYSLDRKDTLGSSSRDASAASPIGTPQATGPESLAAPRLPPSVMTSTETQLASSTSSLSASRDGPSIAQIYKEASELYLTRRIADSLETLQPLLHPRDGSAPIATASRGARIKVWSLYISILNEVVEMGQAEGKTAFGTAAKWKQLASKARDGSIWQDVVDIGYGGAESSVDADVVTNL